MDKEVIPDCFYVNMCVSNWKENEIVDIQGFNLLEIAMYIETVVQSIEDEAYEVEVVNKRNLNSVNKIKFDSACSRNMSGIKGRIVNEIEPSSLISVQGFNNSISHVTSVGYNDDGKLEYYVDNMPSNMVLLCANDYANDGAAILLSNSGYVLRLSEIEKAELEDYLKRFQKTMQLVVRNRTYEVANNVDEMAYSNTATRYFNTKVNVSNNDERIMAMMLTGLTFNDIYEMIRNNNTAGIPREITIKSLNNFSNRYGKSPDVLQLATPNLAGNVKGYMAPKELITYVGQRVEADYMQCEFNEIIHDDKTKTKQTIKISTHGEGIAAYVTVDVYSGLLHGTIVKSVKDSVERVRETVNIYKRDGYKIIKYAADQGVIIQKLFRVGIPEVQQYLLEENIQQECGEPYNHNHGITNIERSIRSIKELMRFAVLYIINNPNFNHLGFTKTDIFKLWGDLFYWAITVINLKPCQNSLKQTKYEVYYKKIPDLRQIRLLPIFAIVYVLRVKGRGNVLVSTRPYYQRGLYIGPSASVPGAIRVVVKTNNRIQIIVTTQFKGVSDGGDVNPYPIINHAIQTIINDTVANNDVTQVVQPQFTSRGEEQNNNNNKF